MRNLLLVAFALCMISISCTQQSQPIAQWRGPNRDGIYPEKNLLAAWPENGPELLWSFEEIGPGFSSPVVTNDRIFINGVVDSTSTIFCFDLSGKLIWKAPNGKEFFGNGYSASFPGARSAPTLYKGLLYVTSGLGRIACLDATTGKMNWTVDMIGDLGGKLNMFGNSESLYVDDKNVYCMPGGTETNLAALDRLTGKVVWTSKALGDAVSFCSPIVINLSERRVLVTLSREYIMGIDLKNGELLWSQKEDSVKYEGEYCNTPVYADGFIYSVSGVDKGTGAFKLRLSPDGKSVQEVWRNGDVKNDLGGFVLVGDQLYCASKDHKLKRLDANTGAVADSLGGFSGSVIFADNRLYCYTDNGYMNLIDISEPKMKRVSKFKIVKGTKEHFSHPVIADGVLYVRHGNALMAYGIR